MSVIRFISKSDVCGVVAIPLEISIIHLCYTVVLLFLRCHFLCISAAQRSYYLVTDIKDTDLK